ncbi:hypothetical protein ACFSCZ_13715 [Siminovitchia sediminis]|uniref:Uncharacterized protein n=1 Tax=Siminovitchia sediminis TaxID=1274353 RepID=A0ABW4KJW4_9BACI
MTGLSDFKMKNGNHYKVTVDGRVDGAHVYVRGNTGYITSITWYTKKSDDGHDGDDDNDDYSNDEDDDD